jgi:hypothetical protein
MQILEEEKTMFRTAKTISTTVVLLAALFSSARADAQSTVVIGTGDPTIDIPAVQAGVDQGGQVVLMGHFSFDAPPTRPDGKTYNRTVTISKAVSILGANDANGDVPSIEGGFVPFFIEVPDQSVLIQRLHFVRPKGAAIWVFAAGGLWVAGCRIEGVEPSTEYANYAAVSNPLANGIFVGSNPSDATQSWQPENFSGTFSIFNNDLDIGGTAGDQTLGIVVFGAGNSPTNEVDLYVSGNRISNVTMRVINIKMVGGRVHLERNLIATGAVAGPSVGLTPDAINVVDSGSYLIAHNSIVSQWATGVCILVQGNASEGGATVVDNDVTMTAPDGTVFGANSAGIMIAGFAQNNGVLNNRIRGRARAALVLATKGKGTPVNNTFVSNDVTGFQSSLADLYVDSGVSSTVVVGLIAKAEDHGTGTVVVPMLNAH